MGSSQGVIPESSLELRSFVQYVGAKCWVLDSLSGCENDGLIPTDAEKLLK